VAKNTDSAKRGTPLIKKAGRELPPGLSIVEKAG